MEPQRYANQITFDPAMYLYLIRNDPKNLVYRVHDLKIKTISGAIEAIPNGQCTSIRCDYTDKEIWDHKLGPVRVIRFDVSVGRVEEFPRMVYLPPVPITLRSLIRHWKLEFPEWKKRKIKHLKENFWWPISDPVKKLYWAVEREVPKW